MVGETYFEDTMKRVNIHKVIHAANKRGLYVLVEGKGDNFKYDFFSRKTGKVVLTYYPVSKRWLGTGDQQGRADDFRAALDAALGPVNASQPSL